MPSSERSLLAVLSNVVMVDDRSRWIVAGYSYSPDREPDLAGIHGLLHGGAREICEPGGSTSWLLLTRLSVPRVEWKVKEGREIPGEKLPSRFARLQLSFWDRRRMGRPVLG
jgi:hypothetical protein